MAVSASASASDLASDVPFSPAGGISQFSMSSLTVGDDEDSMIPSDWTAEATTWANRLVNEIDEMTPENLQILYQYMAAYGDKFIVPFCSNEGLNNLLGLVYKHLENSDLLHNIIVLIHTVMDCDVNNNTTQHRHKLSNASNLSVDDETADEDSREDSHNSHSPAVDHMPLGYEIIASHSNMISVVLDMVCNYSVIDVVLLILFFARMGEWYKQQ